MSVLENILLGRHVHMQPSALASLFYWVWAAKEEVLHRHVVEEIIDFMQQVLIWLFGLCMVLRISCLQR